MIVLLSLMFGCGGEEPPVPTEPVATSAAPVAGAGAVSGDLVGRSWQVRLAVDAARAAFEGKDSWVNRFNGRFLASLEAHVADKVPAAVARAHVEYAAAYRQAALIASHASVLEWGAEAQETDPAEGSYLVGVGGALLADANWRGRLGSAGATRLKPLAAQDTAWKKWADSGAKWPVDAVVATSPGAPSADAAGVAPDAGSLPHYEMPERSPEARKVAAGDPGTLVALSRWHEAAARKAAPELDGWIDVSLDAWRLPVEPFSTSRAPESVPDELVFLSTLTSAADGAFLADLAREGAVATDKHKATSPYAAIVASCTRAPAGGGPVALQVDCVLDESAALGRAIEEGMKVANGGQEAAFHRPFAEYARVGVLQAGYRAAAASGDAEAAGRLRINALDRATGGTAQPAFVLSVAAWDTSNKNTARAEELVHGMLQEVPGLEAARLPLDALHVRVSRNAAPGRPMH